MALASSWIDRRKLGELVAAAAWTPPVVDNLRMPANEPQRPVVVRDGPRFGATTSSAPAAGPAAAPLTARGPEPRTTRIAATRPQPAKPTVAPTTGTPTTGTPTTGTPATARYHAPNGGALEDRLAHLLAWAARTTGLSEAMVADSEGLMVAAHNAGALEEALTAVFESFVLELDPFLGEPIAGHVALRVQGHSLLVTWCATQHGRFFLALRGDSIPAPHSVVGLSDALRDALDEDHK